MGQMNMETEFFFYKCSPEYISTISPTILDEIISIVKRIPKRQFITEINFDLFWLLTSYNWHFHKLPTNINNSTPDELNLSISLNQIIERNNPIICKTSSNLQTLTNSDYAKSYDNGLVQIEVQFKGLEEAAIDFTKFRIGYAEQRVLLGIEIVIYNPKLLLNRPKLEEIVYFDQAKDSLSMIKLDCPILLIGLKG